MRVDLVVNGAPRRVDVDPRKPLLWVLREEAGLPGTKFGCGEGLCGACTVLVDGRPVRSCTAEVGSVRGRLIQTIEGLDAAPLGVALKDAFVAEQVPQCGYCIPGMLVAAVGLLSAMPAPTDADIDREVTNLCRCGTYQRVRRAIHRAAGAKAGGRP